MKYCPRTIDKPLLILGLELEDILLLMFFFGGLAIFFNAFVLLFILPAGVLLVILKRGKPQGYVLHILYSVGVNFKGLLPSGDKIKYSPFYKGGKAKKSKK